MSDAELLELCEAKTSDSSDSNSVSKKHGNDHRNPYAESEELEGQMSFYGTSDKD